MLFVSIPAATLVTAQAMLRIRRIMAVADENAGHFFCLAHLGAPDTIGFL